MCVFVLEKLHRAPPGESPDEVNGKVEAQCSRAGLFGFHVAVGRVLFIIHSVFLRERESERGREGGDMAIKYHAERDRT